MNTDDQLVTIRWTEEREVTASAVRRVAADEHNEMRFAQACREWVAANPLPPKLSDLPAGSIVRWFDSDSIRVVQPDGSWINEKGLRTHDKCHVLDAMASEWKVVHVAVVSDGVQS